MSDIFVSYAREDAEFVGQLVNALHERGGRLWIDTSDIPAGHDWRERIKEGLDNAKCMILFVSPDSMRSVPVEREWRAFLNAKKPIIPVLYRDTLLPNPLKHLNYLDATDLPIEAVVLKLEEELKSTGVRFQRPYSGPVAGTTPSRPRREPTMVIAVLGIMVALLGVLAALAQPFIADWLAQDDLTGTNGSVAALNPQVNSGSTSSTRLPITPSPTLIPLPANSVPLSLGIASENTLTLIALAEADLNGLLLANATGASSSPLDIFDALGIRGGRISEGTCLIYRREGTNDQLPRDCVPALTYEVEFSPIDVFWYDDAGNRPLDIIVQRDQQIITVCTTTSARCDFIW